MSAGKASQHGENLESVFVWWGHKVSATQDD